MAEVRNKDYLKELTKDTSVFKGQKHSQILWDLPGSQLSSEMQSVLEFATNEQHKPLLSRAAWAYKDSTQNYIADEACPFFPVKSLSGQYRSFNERTFYDRANTNKGKDSPPARIEFGSTLTDFTLNGKALAMYLSAVDRDEAVNQYGSVAEWRRICTLFLTRLLLLDRELTVKDIYQTTGNFAGGFTATASPLWSNSAATLQSDVMTGEDALMAPRDTLVMAYDAYRECQKQSAITGATTVSGAKRGPLAPYVNKEAIENFFDAKIIVGSGRYNSTPGSATPTMSRIWANYVTIAHLTQDPGGAELSAPFCRTFKLKSASFPNTNGWSVKIVRDDLGSMAGGEVLMVGFFSDEIVFAQKSGYSLKVL